MVNIVGVGAEVNPNTQNLSTQLQGFFSMQLEASAPFEDISGKGLTICLHLLFLKKNTFLHLQKELCKPNGAVLRHLHSSLDGWSQSVPEACPYPVKTPHLVILGFTV